MEVTCLCAWPSDSRRLGRSLAVMPTRRPDGAVVASNSCWYGTLIRLLPVRCSVIPSSQPCLSYCVHVFARSCSSLFTKSCSSFWTSCVLSFWWWQSHFALVRALTRNEEESMWRSSNEKPLAAKKYVNNSMRWNERMNQQTASGWRYDELPWCAWKKE